MEYYDFSVMNVELTKAMLSDTHDKHNEPSRDMLMRTRITRRVVSVLALHPDWNVDDVFVKVQTAFRKGGGTIIQKAIDRELYDYFVANWSDIIKPEQIEDGKEFEYYTHHSNIKLTKEQWVAKARAKWGNVYDYTDSDYKAGLQPITIRCIKHNHYFTVQACNHTCTSNPRQKYMGGCPICAQERLTEYRRNVHEEALKRRAERKKNTYRKPYQPVPHESPQERFLRRAKEQYPDYDYSLVKYEDRDKPVTIVCPIHGPFDITPRILLNGEKGKKPHGCYKCCGLPDPADKMTAEKFKQKMTELYGNKYKFHFEDYKNQSSIIRYTCKKHGEQKHSASRLLSGKACEYCDGKFYPPDWLKNARAVHGDKYKYDETRPPKRVNDYIYYECPVHGPRKSRYDSHVTQRHGCALCANVTNELSAEERKGIWIAKCRDRYPGRYSYRQVVYKDNDTPVKIYCKEHQITFECTPDTHARGAGGCPLCTKSEGEVHIYKWLTEQGIQFTPQYQIPNDNPDLDLQYLVADFWLPDHNLFIEMNGEQHYMEIEHFKIRRNRNGTVREKQWSLQLQQLRDQTMRQYCQDHNHRLLEIRYDQIGKIPHILHKALQDK